MEGGKGDFPSLRFMGGTLKMKKKQLLGIIVTAVVIIVTGVTGIVSNVIGNQLMAEQSVSFADKLMSSVEMTTEITLPEEEFIGVIDVIGEISASTEDVFGYSTGGYNHSLYMDFVEEMMYADNNKGILLYVDSPGGTVYESDELYLKLMEYKEVTGRPIWAYFASQACSGGYYIAMAADEIYANRNCWTGSIGVIVSMLNTQGLYEKIGIEEINITSGDNKAMGSSGQEMTEEQRAILQSLVDEAYDQFVDIVCVGRNMDSGTVRTLADGRIYTAKQALEADLIDAIGSLEEEKLAFASAEGFAEDITYYAPEAGAVDIFTQLFGKIAELKPQSDAEVMTNFIDNNRNGVLMYYAE